MTCSTMAWARWDFSVSSIGSGLLVNTAVRHEALLFRVVGVHVLDPAHDQPGGHVLGLGLGRERGVGDLGDLGIADPAAGPRRRSH